MAHLQHQGTKFYSAETNIITLHWISGPASDEVPLLDIDDERFEDAEEARTITKFLEEGCGCERNCSAMFSRAHYELNRNWCSELPRELLDMAVMGQLMALTSSSGTSADLLYARIKKGLLEHTDLITVC